jgi:2-octaprenyl-6-methoxyphenol hydroxylase
MNEKHYDVVIIGAGMVGSSFAHLLSDSIMKGLKVAMIEHTDVSTHSISFISENSFSFDGRYTALSYGSSQIFESMGLWQEFSDHVCDINQIEVSKKGQFGQVILTSKEMNVASLGYVCANKQLRKILHDNRLSDIDLYSPAKIKSISLEEKKEQSNDQSYTQSKITLDNQHTIHADLLVFSDGARSQLAQKMGVTYQTHHYDSHAIVTSIRMSQTHNNWAYERFALEGPIALLPQKSKHNNEYALVWTVSNTSISECMGLSDQAFILKLQNQIGSRAGMVLQVGERVSYPLSLTQSSEQVRAGFVLLGNSAHSLHPVAGQGFNLALRDAEALSMAINKSYEQRISVGTLSSLQAYYASRQHDQKNTVSLSHILPKWFTKNNGFINTLSGFGFLLFTLFPSIRNVFSRQAMGLGHVKN